MSVDINNLSLSNRYVELSLYKLMSLHTAYIKFDLFWGSNTRLCLTSALKNYLKQNAHY